MDLPPGFFKSAAMKRNLSQHWHKDPGCKFQPLLNIELDYVLVGELHCLLRVTDRLQEGVINACVWWDTVSCIITKQLNPANSNYQGKSKLLRIIDVSSYRGFEQKDQKHLIKVVLSFIHVLA